jgi:hypothetical protein
VKTKPGRIFNHTPKKKTMNTVWNSENSRTKIIPAEPGVRVQETDRGKSANAKSHPAQTLHVAGWLVTMKAIARRWLGQKRISQWVALIGIATGSTFGIQAAVHAAGNLPADNTCVFTLGHYNADLVMHAENDNWINPHQYAEYNAKIRAESLELEAAGEHYEFTGNRNRSVEFTAQTMTNAIHRAGLNVTNLTERSNALLLSPISVEVLCVNYNAELLYTTDFGNQYTGVVTEAPAVKLNTIRCPGSGNTINSVDPDDESSIFAQPPFPATAGRYDDELIWVTRLGYEWTCTRKPRPLPINSTVVVSGSSIKRIRTADYKTIRTGDTVTLGSCETSIYRTDGSSYGTESEGTVTYKIIDKSTEGRTLYTFGTSTMKDNDSAPFGYCSRDGICDTSSDGNCTSIKGKSWTNTTGANVYLIADTKKTRGAESIIMLSAKFSIK